MFKNQLENSNYYAVMIKLILRLQIAKILKWPTDFLT